MRAFERAYSSAPSADPPAVLAQESGVGVRRHHQQAVDATLHRAHRGGRFRSALPCELDNSRCRPRARAARSMPRISSEKNSPCRSGSSAPMVCVRRVIRLRAALCGVKRNFVAALQDALARLAASCCGGRSTRATRSYRHVGRLRDILDRHRHATPSVATATLRNAIRAPM